MQVGRSVDCPVGSRSQCFIYLELLFARLVHCATSSVCELQQITWKSFEVNLVKVLEVKSEDDEMEVEGEASGVVPSLEELSKDQVSWAQCLLEASYFESCFSPKDCFSPKGELQSGGPGFPDFGAFCPSPLLSDQLKILHNWSSRITKQAEEAVSTSVSSGSEACMSAELDKVGSDLTMRCGESGDGVKESRKRNAPSEEDDGSLIEGKNSSQKKMKVKGSKRMREPRYAIKTRSEVDIMEDGYKWRKYGQKPVKSSPHPRNYYRCTTANCPVRKRVERDTEDTGLVITSYEGTHSHPKVIQQNNPSRLSNNFDHDLSLLDPLGRPGTMSANLLPPFPPVPNLGHLWSSPLNFSGWPQQQAPSAHDNMSLIMAYQLVKFQWELQARTQQFMDFNSQSAAQGPAYSVPEMMNKFAESIDSELQLDQQFPKPELPVSSSLLRKRASAFRNGGPIPLDLQSIAKMQHLRPAAQQMDGRPHAGHDQN